MWTLKLIICIIYDLFDFTIGRLLFATPFMGELIGCVLAGLLFGKAGLFYGLEVIDPTEQFDGFIPTATIIAIANKPQRSQVASSGSLPP
jgi:hypothetical protein